MFLKKLIFTIAVMSSLIQPAQAMTLSKENVMQIISTHKILLKKLSIAILCGFGIYKFFKKVYERVDVQIKDFGNGVIINKNYLKHFPNVANNFMMYKDGKYIGLVVCMNFLNKAVLFNISISKTLRNKGYGKLLLETVIDKLKQDGFTEIYLDADPFDTDSKGIVIFLQSSPEKDDKLKKLIKFYQQTGFEEIAKEDAKKQVTFFNYMDLSYPMKYKIS